MDAGEAELLERIRAEVEANPINRAYQQIGSGLFEAEDLPAALKRREAGERAYFALVLCGSEIDNGGFAQLFTNSTGALIDEAIAGAEHFEAREHAAVLREAKLIFPRGVVPAGHRERLAVWEELCQQQGDELDERLGALDERWYALDTDLESRLGTYARAYLG
jgi:Domain of unknown function (DUF4375)